MKSSFILLCLILLNACTGNTGNQPVNTPGDNVAVKAPAADTTATGIFAYPSDTLVTEAIILCETGYHGDEVSGTVAAKVCYGLFRSAGGYYMDTTRITATSVYDAVLDEDTGLHTGIEIKALHEDSAMFLFCGVQQMYQGPVIPVSLLNRHNGLHDYLSLAPGDTIHFTATGVTYTLFAAGEIHTKENLPSETTITDYRLYITATKAGQTITQLLVAQPSFDDAAVSILFCGDLDGDHIPDFIIDSTYHYNVFQPVLYLSRQAGSHELLHLVARHSSMGC